MPSIQPDQVFALIQQIGPVLPTDITSRTGQNTMIVGAILSSLVAEKRLKYTQAKWGGSPLYYTDAQIELIQKIYPQLNEKDRKAFDLLKAQLVLQDNAQTPLVRACLRSIKDFAIPLTVTAPDGEEFLFWKWYLLADADAAARIKQILLPQYESLMPAVQARLVPPAVPVTPTKTATPVVAPVAKSVSAPKAAKPARVAQTAASDDDFIGSPLIAQKQKAAPIAKAPVSSGPTFQSSLLTPALPTGDEFFVSVNAQLTEKQVVVTSATVVKKNSELDLIISMPTPFGPVTYYAKARKKKKSTDADLSAAYVKGQMLHLPTAYISLGELTKKAQEMLKADFAGVLVITLS